MTTNDFDPQEPYVDEKGFEYRNFAAYIAGEKLPNGRNAQIEAYWDWVEPREECESDCYDEWLWNYYVYYDADGNPLAFNSAQAQAQEQASAGWLEKRLERIPKAAHRFRAGAERRRALLEPQTACPPSGDGGPGAVPAQAAAVHPADEPQVPRGLGA